MGGCWMYHPPIERTFQLTETQNPTDFIYQNIGNEGGIPLGRQINKEVIKLLQGPQINKEVIKLFARATN